MPNNNTLMLSVEFLRDNTVINSDVANELIEPFIISSQNVHIEAIIR